MAVRSVVCNDLLCFLLSKYGKVSNRVLTDTIVESFEDTAIYAVSYTHLTLPTILRV